MGNALTGLKQRFEKFSPRQIIAAGLITALVLTAGVMLTRVLTKPDFDVLYAGLSPSDAAEVVAAVEAAGVQHQLVEGTGTTTVLVPAEDAARMRMDLAAENLPGDSIVGYELLDNQGVTVSTFREQVNYQRALEGELARTLMSIEAVEKAAVHIVLPRERLYTSEDAPATAAVTVTTSGTLARDEVAAITHLVASSVPDLDPSDVTVTDASGQLLTNADGTGSGATGSEAEAAYATLMEGRAMSMLAAAVGEGKAVVRVQADLDFTERTTQTELFDPERVATNKEATEKETYQSRTPGTGGTLTTNPQQGQNRQDDATTSNYERDSADRDFSVSREVSSETDAPGEVKRMTVSVLLDEASSVDATVVQNLVANAVGFDEARGDQIVVDYLPFAAAAEQGDDPAAAEAAAREKTKMITALSLAGVMALGILIGAFMLLRGRRKNKKAAADALVDDATTVIGSPLPGTTAPEPRGTIGVPSSSGGEADRLREAVAERPAAAAGVIRGLIASDEVKGR